MLKYAIRYMCYWLCLYTYETVYSSVSCMYYIAECYVETFSRGPMESDVTWQMVD